MAAFDGRRWSATNDSSPAQLQPRDLVSPNAPSSGTRVQKGHITKPCPVKCYLFGTSCFLFSRIFRARPVVAELPLALQGLRVTGVLGGPQGAGVLAGNRRRVQLALGTEGSGSGNARLEFGTPARYTFLSRGACLPRPPVGVWTWAAWSLDRDEPRGTCFV